MNNNKLIFLSYNVGCSKSLAGLNQLLDMYKPSFVFLQEILMNSANLTSLLGHSYKGISNIDTLDLNKPGTACIWRSHLNVEVSNIVSCRAQILKFNDLAFINIYAPSGTQNQRARRQLFGDYLLNELSSFGIQINQFFAVIGTVWFAHKISQAMSPVSPPNKLVQIPLITRKNQKN